MGLYRCSPLRQPALPHSLGYCQDTLLKMTQKQKALSKEEELLLQDFSRNVSTKSNALFYRNRKLYPKRRNCCFKISAAMFPPNPTHSFTETHLLSLLFPSGYSGGFI